MVETAGLALLGFVLLIKGADFLVSGASLLARRLRVSDLVIGLTIVAFGTSAPELVVNLVASVRGNTDIAIGNILGSNIANVLLILGLATLIFPLRVTKGTVWKEIPLSLLAAALLGLMANDRLLEGRGFSEISRIDGSILLAFFVIFLYYTFGIARVPEESSVLAPAAEHRSLMASVLRILGGLAMLGLGGYWLVTAAVSLAREFGVSESLIGLTIVAVGTSAPELATSVLAAYRRNADIAVGNVVGSNIFNIFFVLGTSALITPLPITASTNADIAVTIAASFLLFLWMFVGKRHVLERWQGVVFLATYVTYIALLVVRG